MIFFLLWHVWWTKDDESIEKVVGEKCPLLTINHFSILWNQVWIVSNLDLFILSSILPYENFYSNLRFFIYLFFFSFLSTLFCLEYFWDSWFLHLYFSIWIISLLYFVYVWIKYFLWCLLLFWCFFPPHTMSFFF